MESIKITVLSKPNCHYCIIAKKMLVKLKDEYPLDVEIIDMSTERGMRIGEKFGFFFPPGILINDKPFSYGRPSEKKVRKALVRLEKSNK